MNTDISIKSLLFTLKLEQLERIKEKGIYSIYYREESRSHGFVLVFPKFDFYRQICEIKFAYSDSN
jgi:hypothetical protein